jgi:hypothetical protein
MDHRAEIANHAQFSYSLDAFRTLRKKTKEAFSPRKSSTSYDREEKMRRTIAFTSDEGNMAGGKAIFKSLAAGSWHAINEDSVAFKMMHLACEPQIHCSGPVLSH